MHNVMAANGNELLSLGFYDAIDSSMRLVDFFPRDQNVVYAGNACVDSTTGDQFSTGGNMQYVELKSLCPPPPPVSPASIGKVNNVVEDNNEEESRKRRRSERLKVQSTIPIHPNTTISGQVSQINDEIVRLETVDASAVEVNDEIIDSGEEEEEDEDLQGGEGEDGSIVGGKRKKYPAPWKDVGYDELAKVYRSFTQYERSLNQFASQFAHTSYLCHPFWLGRSHVNESKQSAMEYLTNEVMASCVSHGKALRNMRGFLENLPFCPGTTSSGKKIITYHPTEQYSCKRLVNAVKKKGEMVAMPDLVEYLEKKQKLIDAKQVCENTQVVTSAVVMEMNAPKKYVKPPAMTFANYREEYFKLICKYFKPHDELGYDKTKMMIKAKLGMDINRKFVNWFSKQFKQYCNIYSNSKTNPITSEEMLDAALKDHMTSFEVSFQKFLVGIGKESSIYSSSL